MPIGGPFGGGAEFPPYDIFACTSYGGSLIGAIYVGAQKGDDVVFFDAQNTILFSPRPGVISAVITGVILNGSGGAFSTMAADSDFFYASNRAGAQQCHRSADGINWTSSAPIGFSQQGVIINTNPYTGTMMFGNRRSTDQGLTFSAATGLATNNRGGRMAATPTTWFAGWGGGFSGAPRISFDDGVNWVVPNLPYPDNTLVVPYYWEELDLMFGFSTLFPVGDLWVSFNRGQDWQQVTDAPMRNLANFFTGAGNGPMVGMVYNPDDGMYYGSNGKAIIGRTPDGINWEVMPLALNGSTYNSQDTTVPAPSRAAFRNGILEFGTATVSGPANQLGRVVTNLRAA